MSDDVKVGDTIYRFDINRRRYTEGVTWGQRQIIFAEHFEAFEICGETKFSWLVDGNRDIKVNKKTMRESVPNMPGHQWYTEEGRLLKVYMNEHGPAIHRAMHVLTDEQLLRIAEVLGLGLPPLPTPSKDHPNG